jgi:hypothetical protein
VIRKFEDPSWDSDEKAGGDKFVTNQKEVIDLLTQMQDCGPPPKEILGDMPAGKLAQLPIFIYHHSLGEHHLIFFLVYRK